MCNEVDMSDRISTVYLNSMCNVTDKVDEISNIYLYIIGNVTVINVFIIALVNIYLFGRLD
jgi:hypothetical protein